jgi:hypothetical protein
MAAPSAVHPHLPRFAQGVTGVLSLEALIFRDRWVVAVALALVLIALIRPEWSPVNAIFRRLVGTADQLEPAAPVRFSQGLAAAMLAVALVLIVAGATVAGWVIVGIVSVVALFSAISGICVGCAIYRVALVRRSRNGDLRAELGLTGDGPWLVVLTAPGCRRCEPVERQLRTIAGDGAVTRIDLAQTPAAAHLPVKSVPAVIVVDADGHIRETHTGRLDRPVLETAAAAV